MYYLSLFQFLRFKDILWNRVGTLRSRFSSALDADCRLSQTMGTFPCHRRWKKSIRDVIIACSTKEFSADRWNPTISDAPGYKNFTRAGGIQGQTRQHSNNVSGFNVRCLNHSWFTPDSLFLCKQIHFFCLQTQI